MFRPEVSVIIPCFNQGRYLYEAMCTAKECSTSSIEIIVVNDGSVDRTSDIVAELADELADARCEIVIVHQENRGLPGARNAGLAKARGTYIQFLDADDLLMRGKVDQQIQHFLLASNLDVSISECLFGTEELVDFTTENHMLFGFDYNVFNFAFDWERGFSIPIHCALFRRQLFDDMHFSESIKAKEDWVLWCSFAVRGVRIGYLGSIGALYRVHSQSMCRDMPRLGRQWLRAATEIDTVMADIYPQFLGKAVEWYALTYFRTDAKDINNDGKNAAKKVGISLKPAPELTLTHRIKVNNVKLSIVIPVYNHFEYLTQCFDSAMCQTETEIEIVLCDDASTDVRVEQLCRKYASADERIKYVRNENNLGIARNQNNAAKIAQGKYIGFLDCDDVLEINAVERAIACLNDTKADYFFSDFFDIDVDGKKLRLSRYGGYRENRFTGDIDRDLLFGMPASHFKVVNREMFLRLDGFSERFSGVQDWEFALKAALSGNKFAYLPLPLYQHRRHSTSVTSSQRRRQYLVGNRLRREFCEKSSSWFSVRSEFISLAQAMLSGACTITDGSGMGLSIELSEKITKRDVWFIREFNGFFNIIRTGTVETYFSLIGYVYASNVLVFEEPVV